MNNKKTTNIASTAGLVGSLSSYPAAFTPATDGCRIQTLVGSSLADSF